MKPTIRHHLLAALGALFIPTAAPASSHMDAPLVTLDPAANTTDVYAFVSTIGGVKYLTTALAVYPFEEPGIGPNKYNFDDKVIYTINLATGANVTDGKPTLAYEFRFRTNFKNQNTIAQSYLGVVEAVDDPQQNLTQHYTVTKVAPKRTTLLADGLVPPNNQGLVTKYYNQGDSGENPAREGVANPAALDRYTASAIYSTPEGYRIFAGQRDDGFYADIQSIFDLDFGFTGANKPFDSQGGFNVHTIVLSIPLAEIPGGDQQNVGVWATTSRSQIFVLRRPGNGKPVAVARGVQVGRQGNPLFCEAIVPLIDKDRYNRGTAARDPADFRTYALAPELATLIGAAVDRRTNRTDLAGIFIPDLIKVDLSTGPAKLAGGSNPGAAADDVGFHRLSIFGGDTLTSTITPGFGGGAIPGGWPNGRRFGDDVVDIAVLAILSDLRTSPPMIVGNAASDVDKVKANDIGYNKVFPYAPTPQNGRNHGHP